jgi:hypothetical protein
MSSAAYVRSITRLRRVILCRFPRFAQQLDHVSNRFRSAAASPGRRLESGAKLILGVALRRIAGVARHDFDLARCYCQVFGQSGHCSNVAVELSRAWRLMSEMSSSQSSGPMTFSFRLIRIEVGIGCSQSASRLRIEDRSPSESGSVWYASSSSAACYSAGDTPLRLNRHIQMALSALRTSSAIPFGAMLYRRASCAISSSVR